MKRKRGERIKSRIIDLSGQRFGKLVAIKCVGLDNGRNAIWECICDCGQFKEVSSKALRHSGVKSCGCSHKEVMNDYFDSRLGTSEDRSLKKLFLRYKGRAKARNYSFDLKYSQFKKLVFGECYYCGSKPETKIVSKSGVIAFYNGIDRLNNEEGYTLLNCITCCGICNYMKRDMSIDEFIRHIEKILDKHGKSSR